MLQSLGNNAECQRLGTGLCLTLRGPVGEDSRQVGDLRDPSTIVLLLELNRESQTPPPVGSAILLRATIHKKPAPPLAPRRWVRVRRTPR
jgi:hypothetical protein